MRLLAGSERFHLVTDQARQVLHCGDPLELKVGGRWERGWVEFSDRQGWYWTNDKSSARLLEGFEGRVWDGREWPNPERERPGLER